MSRSQGTTIAIGDVHGCARHLEMLRRWIDLSRPRSRIVFVGDLLTKGPDPAGVVDQIGRWRRGGREIVMVCGNHDLRMIEAIEALESGRSINELPSHEQVSIKALNRAGALDTAHELLKEVVQRSELHPPGAGWTVLHAGIDPDLGLFGTPTESRIHLKDAPTSVPWWDRYDGSDGLLVVGHRPVDSPIQRFDRDGHPIVVNIDTGCAGGGPLTAYEIEAGRFIQAGSLRTPNRCVEWSLQRPGSQSYPSLQSA